MNSLKSQISRRISACVRCRRQGNLCLHYLLTVKHLQGKLYEINLDLHWLKTWGDYKSSLHCSLLQMQPLKQKLCKLYGETHNNSLFNIWFVNPARTLTCKYFVNNRIKTRHFKRMQLTFSSVMKEWNVTDLKEWIDFWTKEASTQVHILFVYTDTDIVVVFLA